MLPPRGAPRLPGMLPPRGAPRLPGMPWVPGRTGRTARWRSFPQLLAGEVDEHRLQARLVHRHVDQGEPAAFGRHGDPREDPVVTTHVQLEPARDRVAAGDTWYLPGQQLGEPVAVAGRLHGDDGI